MTHTFRWDRHGRKGRPCRVTARSSVGRPGCGPALAFGAQHVKRFNSIRIEFADGYRMVTSGNAIRRIGPGAPP